MGTVYEQLKSFKSRYPSTIAWRLKSHSKVIEKHLNPDEEVDYIFPAQRGTSSMDIFSTFVVALTNKRIMVAQKRLIFGYNFVAITPDMFNDFTVKAGIIWSKLYIDTIKETVLLSNVSKAASAEIETQITEHMMNGKKEYAKREEDR